MTDQDQIAMPEITFDENGELMIIASPSSSHHDFDFFEGKWNLHNKKLKSRLNNGVA